MKQQTAEDINILGAFCGKRDVESLTPECLQSKYGIKRADVIVQNEDLAYRSEIHGMWDVDRYVNLLMGEITRLTDDANGYGPLGKNFIAHVDIPEEVQHAFEELRKVYGSQIREANPLYASRQRDVLPLLSSTIVL